MDRILSAPRAFYPAPQPDDHLTDPTVLVADWVGPNGEIVLLARDSRRRLIGEPMQIPHGANRLAASDEMWDRVDAVVRAERPLKLI